MPDAVRAAYAAYGVAIPAPAGSAAPQAPAEEAPAVTTLQAAAAVLSKEMGDGDGSRTAQDLAAAEERAGILFDAAHVEAVRTAALEQARAEYAAELAETRRQLTLIAGSRRQVEAVLRLCEGRRGDDMLLVSAVAVAAECGSTVLDDLPMTLTWTGRVAMPEAAPASPSRAVVECTSSYGGRAALVIEGKDRTALASLLDLQVRDIHATCATDGCGTADDYDASDPAMSGWSRLQIAALGDEPRWYCSDMCVFDALARAGHELAAEDRAAAVDPGEQGPQLPDHLVDEAAVADDVARCVRCGCTEAQACEGGCHWIPNRDMVDLCSACATPTEMFYAAGGPR
jgi:hypothetical protein